MDGSSRYLELLGEDDLLVLGRASGLRPGADAPAWFRARSSRVTAALDAPATFEALFPAGPTGPDGQLESVTPLLIFAVMIHRAAADIGGHTHVPERVGSRLLVPLFDGGRLAAFASDPAARLLLVELLGSFTRIASGPQWELSRGRWRRRRFSEMNPAHLARLAADLPFDERAGTYRRLGDLALFLNGVFPDHAARTTLSPIDVDRILRSIPHHDRAELARLVQQDRLDATGALLGTLGPRWYRLASALVPIPSMRSQLADLADEFDLARRFLNFVTDRYLWARRDRLFPFA